MLRKVNGTAPEDYAKAIPAQTHAPDFDMVAELKAWRLRWLGHVLQYMFECRYFSLSREGYIEHESHEHLHVFEEE